MKYIWSGRKNIVANRKPENGFRTIHHKMLLIYKPVQIEICKFLSTNFAANGMQTACFVIDKIVIEKFVHISYVDGFYCKKIETLYRCFALEYFEK